MTCQCIPALGVWSFHARSRIHPDRCRRVRFDVNVDGTQHSSCWLAVDAESPKSRIVNSSLSGASSRAKPAPALSWPDLRFLHLSLICSPLESVVPISTSFSVPFIFSTQKLCDVCISLFWIVSSRSLLFWMSVFVPAPSSAVIDGCSKLSWIFHPLVSLPFAVHHLTLQVPSVLEYFQLVAAKHF